MMAFIFICAFALAALIGMWLAVRGGRTELSSLDDLPRLTQPLLPRERTWWRRR